MVETSLIIGSLALALSVGIIVIAIVALVYSLEIPTITLGNITTGSIAATGPINGSSTISATSGTTISNTDLIGAAVTIDGNSTVGGLVNSEINTASILTSTNTTNSTSTSGALINSGGIGTNGAIYVNDNLFFPNTATGSTNGLNYYEEYTLVTTLTGPWASAQAWSLYLVRKGSSVTAQWTLVSATATSTNFISASGFIPTRFLNSNLATNAVCFDVIIENNSAQTIGQLQIVMNAGTSPGLITFTADVTGQTEFENSGTAAVFQGVANWTLN